MNAMSFNSYPSNMIILQYQQIQIFSFRSSSIYMKVIILCSDKTMKCIRHYGFQT
jgi:hypothetical protein